MFMPAAVPYISQFYPLGNTPAVSLTRALPQGSDADILLLGCGDVRNILYTAYTERGFPLRRLDITCCDVEQSILGKLLQLPAKLSFTHSSQPGTFSSSRTYGSVLTFCDGGSLHLVKEVWSKYAAPDSESCSLAQFVKHLQDAHEFFEDRREGADTAGVITGLRSAAPLSLASNGAVAQAYKGFWVHGTFSVLSAPLPNPLFAESLSQNLFIYTGTNPIIGFHLATAFARLAPDSPLNPDSGKGGVWRVIDAARVQFREWTSAFQDISNSRLSLRFVVADALSFSHILQFTSAKDSTAANIYRRMLDPSPLILDVESYGVNGSAPTSFDVIDTSNLADHIGALNILVASAPLLKSSVRSILYTETLSKSSKTRKDQFNDLLCGHAPTMSLLIGLVPVDYWTNTTSISCADELLINAVFSNQQGQQAHSRIAWKLAKYFSPEQPISGVITAPAPELAIMIFGVYHKMFSNEDNTTNLRNMTPDEFFKKVRTPADAFYHRGSFAALLKCVQRHISTDWPAFWNMLGDLNRSMGAPPASLRGRFGQEMDVQLHLQGVYRENVLRVRTRPNIGMDCFDRWEHIPDLLCITIIVPRKDIEHLYSTKPSRITPPILNISLKSPDWENYYSSMQIAFGDIETSGVSSSDAFSISIRPDPRGWQGKSPMIVSFYASTDVLLSLLKANPKEALIGLNVQLAFPTMAKFVHLLPALTVYETSLGDRETVFFTKYMPGMSGYPAIGSRVGTISPRDANRDDAYRTSISVHFGHFENNRILSICNLVEFLSAESRKFLREKAPIELRESSPSSIEIVFGNGLLVCPIYFPLPVTGHQAKSRIARKSGYIEITIPVADPIASKPLSSFMYPVAIDEKLQPVIFNGNHVNLDLLPILSVGNQDKEANQWLVTLASHQFSLRERKLRELAQEEGGISTSLRLNFKESLFTMFMVSSGLQGGATGLFTLTHPKGGIQLIIFVRAIRIDGAAGSAVLDAAVLPLTHKLVKSGEIGDFLLILREFLFCPISVNDEELFLWKKVLLAFAERCRTWSHGPDCEYKKPGATVPLSEKPGEQFICTCSNGTLPDQFINIPEWEEASKYMVRVAISLTFCVPFMENILNAQGLGARGKDRESALRQMS
ncbi:MYND finger [Biscogniauxia mediterranea]|nr:MYND finger [Biscogniauxia mediterranea]